MPQNKGNVKAIYSHLFGKWRLEGNLQEFVSGTRFYTDDQTGLRVLLHGYASTNLGVKVGWNGNAYVQRRLRGDGQLPLARPNDPGWVGAHVLNDGVETGCEQGHRGQVCTVQ
jgi:hypothetical protein